MSRTSGLFGKRVSSSPPVPSDCPAAGGGRAREDDRQSTASSRSGRSGGAAEKLLALSERDQEFRKKILLRIQNRLLNDKRYNFGKFKRLFDSRPSRVAWLTENLGITLRDLCEVFLQALRMEAEKILALELEMRLDNDAASFGDKWSKIIDDLVIKRFQTDKFIAQFKAGIDDLKNEINYENVLTQKILMQAEVIFSREKDEPRARNIGNQKPWEKLEELKAGKTGEKFSTTSDDDQKYYNRWWLIVEKLRERIGLINIPEASDEEPDLEEVTDDVVVAKLHKFETWIQSKFSRFFGKPAAESTAAPVPTPPRLADTPTPIIYRAKLIALEKHNIRPLIKQARAAQEKRKNIDLELPVHEMEIEDIREVSSVPLLEIVRRGKQFDRYIATHRQKNFSWLQKEMEKIKLLIDHEDFITKRLCHGDEELIRLSGETQKTMFEIINDLDEIIKNFLIKDEYLNRKLVLDTRMRYLRADIVKIEEAETISPEDQKKEKDLIEEEIRELQPEMDALERAKNECSTRLTIIEQELQSLFRKMHETEERVLGRMRDKINALATEIRGLMDSIADDSSHTPVNIGILQAQKNRCAKEIKEIEAYIEIFFNLPKLLQYEIQNLILKIEESKPTSQEQEQLQNRIRAFSEFFTCMQEDASANKAQYIYIGTRNRNDIFALSLLEHFIEDVNLPLVSDPLGPVEENFRAQVQPLHRFSRYAEVLEKNISDELFLECTKIFHDSERRATILQTAMLAYFRAKEEFPSKTWPQYLTRYLQEKIASLNLVISTLEAGGGDATSQKTELEKHKKILQEFSGDVENFKRYNDILSALLERVEEYLLPFSIFNLVSEYLSNAELEKVRNFRNKLRVKKVLFDLLRELSASKTYVQIEDEFRIKMAVWKETDPEILSNHADEDILLEFFPLSSAEEDMPDYDALSQNISEYFEHEIALFQEMQHILRRALQGARRGAAIKMQEKKRLIDAIEKIDAIRKHDGDATACDYSLPEEMDLSAFIHSAERKVDGRRRHLESEILSAREKFEQYSALSSVRCGIFFTRLRVEIEAKTLELAILNQEFPAPKVLPAI